MSSVPGEWVDIAVKEEVLYDVSTHHADDPTFLQAENGVNVGLVDNIMAEDEYKEYNTQPFTGWRTRAPVTDTQPALSQIAHSTHSFESNYGCRQCGKKFYVKLALMVHEQSHISEAINSGSGGYNGNTGISTSTSVPGISSRVKSEQNDEHHFGEQGSEGIEVEVENSNAHEATPLLLKNEHYDRHCPTVSKYVCLYCEKRFKRQSWLRDHTFIHTGERPHQCDVCGEGFFKKIDCRIHKMSHGKTPYICNYCGKRFPKPHILRAHTLLHKGPEPYTCLMCNVRFPTAEIREQHMEMHNKDEYENVAATTRGRYAPVKGPYECETCGKIFRVPSLLKMHQLMHTDERPYTCEFCNASFNRAGILKHHLRRHTGERPYACEICDRRFSQSGSLKSHIRTHTGERPYACKFCDKRFIQSGKLCSHICKHSGSTPYWCADCSAQFSTKDDMVSHRKNTHEIEQTSE